MTSLSSQERTVIQTLLELNYSVRAIARFIKRSPSTVSIEIALILKKWTIFIQLLRQHLRYVCYYKNLYTNLCLLGLQLMFGMPSDTPLHASILNETLPYGHYRTDGL